MFALRARQFKQRRNWNLTVIDDAERDRFDDLDPLYICVTDQGRLLASLRLLPTTGPNMLRDVFPEVGAPEGTIRDPLIYESSRFCVDTTAARDYGISGINHVTRELLTGLFTHALNAGLINIVSVYDLYLERILRRAGCLFERLGAVHKYDGLATVAGRFEVSQDVIDALSTEPAITSVELSPKLSADLADHGTTAAPAL